MYRVSSGPSGQIIVFARDGFLDGIFLQKIPSSIYDRLSSNREGEFLPHKCCAILRRGRDSNSRYSFLHTRFPGVPVKPLLHLSEIAEIVGQAMLDLNHLLKNFLCHELPSYFRILLDESKSKEHHHL